MSFLVTRMIIRPAMGVWAVLALLLTGCASSAEPDADSAPTEQPSSSASSTPTETSESEIPVSEV